MSIIMAGNVASLHYPNSRMGSMVRKTSMYPTASMETRIHRLIKDHGTVLVPGCYDAISAAILEKTGFKAGFISGYSLSASLLAKPDLGFLTSLSLWIRILHNLGGVSLSVVLTPEIAEAARFVCAAAPHIPIMVDADNGGGNALNVKRTVEDLIGAGAAGCFLEVEMAIGKSQQEVLPKDDRREMVMALPKNVCRNWWAPEMGWHPQPRGSK